MLAIAAIVLIGGVTINSLWTARTERLNNTLQWLSRIDMVFAEQTGRAVETVDVILWDIAASPAGDRLSHVETNISLLLQVAITDKSGVIQSSTGPIRKLPADMMAFVSSGGLHVRFSEPFRLPDNTWTALMVRPMPTNGYIVAFLRLKYFEDFYRDVDLGNSGAILLHLRDGTVIARYPPNNSVIGRSYANTPPFKDILAHGNAGTCIMNSPIDGATRILAIRALKKYPLAVNISVGENATLAAWWQQVITFSLIALAAVLAIIGLLHVFEITVLLRTKAQD